MRQYSQTRGMLLCQVACLPQVLARAQNHQILRALKIEIPIHHVSPGHQHEHWELCFSPSPAICKSALSWPSGRVSWLTLARHTNVCVQVGNFFFEPRELDGYFRFLPTELDGFQLNRDDRLAWHWLVPLVEGRLLEGCEVTNKDEWDDCGGDPMDGCCITGLDGCCMIGLDGCCTMGLEVNCCTPNPAVCRHCTCSCCVPVPKQ